MRRVTRLAARGLVLGAIVAGLALTLAGSASAAPTFPGFPDCKDAPTAQLPGSGTAGLLDPGPRTPHTPSDPFVAHPRTSVYEQYGYAGLSWHTYDLGCGGGIRDLEASTDTAIGSFLMGAATWGTAATNGLHATISHPSQYMAPLDDVVTAVTQRLHDAIWNPWGATALVGVGGMLLFYSVQGRLSSVTSAAAWAVLVLAVVAAIGQYPSRVATAFDHAVTGSVATINASVGGLSNLPPSADPARAQGALVVDRVLYDGWLRGELGSSDSPAAHRWGPALYRASAFTWSEAEQARRDPAAGQRLADAKAQSWKDTAAQIQQQDPVAYTALQGKAGGRAGDGLMVVLASTFTLLFRLVADLFLFAGLVMLRVLVMLFPAIAVVGVMAPLAATVRRVFSMGGAALVNVVAFSAGSAVHTTMVSAILTRASNAGMGILGLVLCFVVTVAAFVVLYPLLTFSSILGQAGGPRWLNRGGRELWSFTSRRIATREGVEDAQGAHVPHAGAGGAAASSAMGATRAEADRLERPVVWVSAPPAESFARPVTASPAIAPIPAHLAGNVLPPGPDPAYALVEPAGPNLLPGGDDVPVATQTQPGQQVPHGPETIRGTLVQEVPENLPVLANLVHDSHHEIRRDGVGPRLYDPDTKRSSLSTPVQAPA